MKIAVDIDEDALRKAAQSLQSSTLLDDLSKDPKRVLSKLGVSIDDETAKTISARASQRSKSATGAAAAIIHIDT